MTARHLILLEVSSPIASLAPVLPLHAIFMDLVAGRQFARDFVKFSVLKME
jgi:hypothetical protein